MNFGVSSSGLDTAMNSWVYGLGQNFTVWILIGVPIALVLFIRIWDTLLKVLFGGANMVMGGAGSGLGGFRGRVDSNWMADPFYHDAEGNTLWDRVYVRNWYQAEGFHADTPEMGGLGEDVARHEGYAGPGYGD